MQAAMPWLARTFQFGREPGEFPSLLQRLRGTPARARDLVADIPEDRLGERPDGRRWSAKENIAHLADLQPLDDLRLREYRSGAAVLSAADMSNAATESAEHNRTPSDTILRRLSDARRAWVAELEALSDADLVRTAVHPRLRQPMRLIDWACFVAEHDDHHLARAHEALQSLSGRPAGTRAARPPVVEMPPGRALFEIPDEVTYLNCASMAPQLRSVTAIGREAVRAKATPWILSAADWFAGAEELRGLAAAVAGVDTDGIAIVPAVSYGVAVAARNASIRAGQSIVVLDQEFPSNILAWRSMARRTGARVVTAERNGDETWTEAILRAIDERTAVVSVPHCHWTDGRRLDLEQVGALARGVGAMLVVDASQSLGAYPLDVNRIQPDFLVAVGYKWLLGPYGLGYLYVAPRWREEGVPLEESWLTRAGSDDFARLVDDRDEYRSGARRFDAGEFPQFVLVPMASVALRQILSWSVARVQQSLSELTDRVAQQAADSGYLVPPPDQRVGHMLGLRLPGGVPRDLPSALAAARIHVSIRGEAIRIAPHLYNTEADIDRLFTTMWKAARS